MAYKYLTLARVNSTIKKHGLELCYSKGHKEFRFLDLKTKEQVGQTVVVDKLHSLTIGGWRDAAAAARGSVADGHKEAEAAHRGATFEVARMMQEDAAKVRELLSDLV